MSVSRLQNFQSSHNQASSILRTNRNHHSTGGVLQSIRGYLYIQKLFRTNISYQIDGISLKELFIRDHKPVNQRNEGNLYFLCGEKYQKQEECVKENEKLIWLTYRKNFKLDSGLSSDIGWGCLIRVAQMALAQSLKTFFKTGSSDFEKSYIINAFLEEQGSDTKYNLQKFTTKGKQMWNKKLGQWYSMTEATTTIKSLHQHSPLKGSQNLKIKVYNEIIDVQEILTALGQQRCKCDGSRVYCSICQSIPGTDIQSASKKLDRKNKQVLLMLTTSLGTSQNYADLLRLIELPFFSGCLGGVPNKARFITGKHGQKLSYLDPHYVQQSVERLTLHKNKDTFSCKQYRLMSKDELSPDMTICFHLKNSMDLQKLVDAINSLKSRETVPNDREDAGIISYELYPPIIPKLNQASHKQGAIPLNFEDIDRYSKESQEGRLSAELTFIME